MSKEKKQKKTMIDWSVDGKTEAALEIVLLKKPYTGAKSGKQYDVCAAQLNAHDCRFKDSGIIVLYDVFYILTLFYSSLPLFSLLNLINHLDRTNWSKLED